VFLGDVDSFTGGQTVSRRKSKGKGAAKKSGRDPKKNKSTKKSTTKSTKRTPQRPAEKPTPRAIKEPAKKDEGNDAKKPVDMAQARENVSDLVRESAAAIATGVIAVAKNGQLASAKYLFEAVGLYPATGQTLERPEGDSLAHTLLRRMGIPLEPVVTDDDDVPVASASDARGMDDESAGPGVEHEEARAGCEKEQRLVEGKESRRG
jgi:hypothetical protein